MADTTSAMAFSFGDGTDVVTNAVATITCGRKRHTSSTKNHEDRRGGPRGLHRRSNQRSSDDNLRA